MPQFPLRIGDASDTMFKLDVRDDFVTLLREVPGVADAEVVSHLLGEGDAGGESVVRPTGIVYQVRQEVGGGLESDSLLGERRTTQSLQLWCADQPWRLYEEFATCLGARPVRRVAERSWLVAWGEGGR